MLWPADEGALYCGRIQRLKKFDAGREAALRRQREKDARLAVMTEIILAIVGIAVCVAVVVYVWIYMPWGE